MTQTFDFKIKCIVLGEEGVGKTAILRQSTEDPIAQSAELIVGVEFFIKLLQYKNYRIKLLIWDIATNHSYQHLRSTYYKGAKGCIIVGDLTSRRSFDHVAEWANEVHRYTETIRILLVGNKKDLVESRSISYDEAQTLAQTLNIQYIECSAQSGEGIEDIFTILTDLMMKEIE